MVALSIDVYRTDTPDGVKDYISCLPRELVFSRGLAPEAIIGVLLRPLEPGEEITPTVFARNRVFVEFMHDVIARRGPGVPAIVAEAQRQRDGWVYIIDQRTRTPHGPVPPEDIVGAFQVKNGQIAPGSYQPSPRHLILSANGFFQLGPELQACLTEELARVT